MTARTWLVATATIALLLVVGATASSQLGASDCDAVVADGESIQDAIDAANEGDVICIETGVYEENLLVPTDALTLTAAEGAVPILDGSSTTGPGILVDGADDVRIERLHVRGYADEGIEVDEAAAPRIVDNVVETNGRYGILAEGTPSPVVTGNLVALNGQASDVFDDGIAIHHDAGTHPVNATIAENTVTANGGAGIQLFHADGVVLEANAVVNNGDDGIQVEDSPAALVRANHALANGGSGISVNGADLLVQNNTAVGNERSGVQVSYAQQVEVHHNELEANGVGVSLHGDSPDAILRSNSIAENEEGVQTSDLAAGLIVDARWNWWGSTDGPSGGVEDPDTGESAEGSGDTVGERVRFDPWLEHHPVLEDGPVSPIGSVP